MDGYMAVRAQARLLLRSNKRGEAAELLTKNFRSQFIKMRTFLKQELAATQKQN